MGQISDLAERHSEVGRRCSFFPSFVVFFFFGLKSLIIKSLISSHFHAVVFAPERRLRRVKVGHAVFQKKAFSSEIPNV